MTPLDFIFLTICLVLTVFSAFLALAEVALTRMSRAKALSLREDKRRGAVKLLKLVDKPENWMNPLIFLLLVATSVSAVLLSAVLDRYGVAGTIGAVVVNVLVFFVFAEAAPKTWSLQHTERAALFTAPLISAVVDFWPLRMIARGLIGLSNVYCPVKE